MARRRTEPFLRFWAILGLQSCEGCWLWPGGKTGEGYGGFWDGNRTIGAHRFAYESIRGAIPEGLVLDHLCRTPHCCNPWHMEITTQRTNTIRGVGPAAINSKKTHCVNGHEFTEENTYLVGPARSRRNCRICLRDATKRYRIKKAMRS